MSDRLPINQIKLNPNNPRLIRDDKFKKLVQSLKDFPEMADVREVVINKDNIILGGNTDEFYSKEGTDPKSKMLVTLHPDVTRLVWKFKRYHHHVDYRPFRSNKLIKADDKVYNGIDNFGMELKNA
jgi:hypothetical protein